MNGEYLLLGRSYQQTPLPSSLNQAWALLESHDTSKRHLSERNADRGSFPVRASSFSSSETCSCSADSDVTTMRLRGSEAKLEMDPQH